ncbi:MAG: low molecular weight protein-tyrosine-phosphatase [Kiloniellaceae bacterium]
MAFRILTVCTGNICRSPSAEAILRDRLAEAGLGALVEVDSAGTFDYHIGAPPSEPAVRLAARRGYDLSALRARQVAAEDFTAFDLMLAMDSGHLRHLEALRPPQARSRISLFLEVMPEGGPDVADPYYGDDSDYLAMLDVIEAATPGWIARLREELKAGA